MDKTFKVFKLFHPDGGIGYAWVLMNPDENDIVIHKTRCVTIGDETIGIPYEAIPGEVLNDGARYIKDLAIKTGSINRDEKFRKQRPHDCALMDFFWKTMKSPIIEYVGEIKSSELKKLR